jgi:hypothetical protein
MVDQLKMCDAMVKESVQPDPPAWRNQKTFQVKFLKTLKKIEIIEEINKNSFLSCI